MPEWEVVPPKATGRRAVVHMVVDILVEVQETDSWTYMEEQAKTELRKRVLEGKGFLPFRSRAEMVHDGVTVDQLQHRITIHPQRGF